MPIAERLSSRLVEDEETGCLNWTGNLSHNGYGQMGLGGRGNKGRSHRVAYELAKGPIPDGLQIDHLCRNRRCCNPDHLEAVTREENIARGNAPHILNTRKTHCKRGHPLSGENVRTGRRGERVCVACACTVVREAQNERKRKAWLLNKPNRTPIPRGIKLSDADVQEVRRRRASGEKLTSIAADFGIDPSRVGRIASRSGQAPADQSHAAGVKLEGRAP